MSGFLQSGSELSWMHLLGLMHRSVAQTQDWDFQHDAGSSCWGLHCGPLPKCAGDPFSILWPVFGTIMPFNIGQIVVFVVL